LLRRGDYGLQDDTQELNFGNPVYKPKIRYDRALLPHWEEFYNAMSSWQLSSIPGAIERTQPFNVVLSNIQLPANVVNKLRECFD